jgi:hypothetical protein
VNGWDLVWQGLYRIGVLLLSIIALGLALGVLATR